MLIWCLGNIPYYYQEKQSLLDILMLNMHKTPNFRLSLEPSIALRFYFNNIDKTFHATTIHPQIQPINHQ